MVVDREQHFYPPGLLALGVDLREVLVVRPNGQGTLALKEEQWALEQALRNAAVSVAMVWMGSLESHAYRRLQLAAEEGKTVLQLIRPHQVQEAPTWADVQLQVTPLPGRFHEATSQRTCRVTLLRQRGQVSPQRVGTYVDVVCGNGEQQQEGSAHETRPLRMAPGMVPIADRRRSAGA